MLDKNKEARESKLIFNITFHPTFGKLKEVLQRIHLLLTPDGEHRTVFPEVPIVGFKRGKSIRDFLVKAKLPPLEEDWVCNGCGASRCKVCETIEDATTFSDKDKTCSYKIRKGMLNCNSNYVICLFSCKVCGVQYVGSTKTAFRIRFNNYKSKHRKFREMFFNGTLKGASGVEQKIFHQHFCNDGHHGDEDWSVTLIDQVDNLPMLRKNERFWQYKLNTFYPNGLNEKEVPQIFQ